MTDAKTIEAGNRLIAEFMNLETMTWEAERIGTMLIWIDKTTKMTVYDSPELFYHSDWNWLMPVVEKIESFSTPLIEKVWIDINGHSCGLWTYFDVIETLRTDNSNDGRFKVKNTDKTKIIATWRTVVDFITWYNNTQTKQQ